MKITPCSSKNISEIQISSLVQVYFVFKNPAVDENSEKLPEYFIGFYSRWLVEYSQFMYIAEGKGTDSLKFLNSTQLN
jgi:hypothetical protein